MFQSLFYWILFFYKDRNEALQVAKSSFNPYSTGFYSFIYDDSIGDEEE